MGEGAQRQESDRKASVRRRDKAGQSLSTKIFSSVLVFTLLAVVVFSGMVALIFYVSYEEDAEAELLGQAVAVASVLDVVDGSERIGLLESQFEGGARLTYVAPDGTVLYDSVLVDISATENHADRLEVAQALTQGQASDIRYSSTLGTDTVYAAAKLADGSVIRLAETQQSIFTFLSTMIVPVTVALVVVVVLVFLLSKALTNRIMKPIDALSFTVPLENRVYREMSPFLERIDEQQRQLRRQNEELERATSMRREFSANVSHEMKTPLQVISGYAELMMNDMVDPRDRKRIAKLIYEEAQAMRSLINDVLTLSRLDESVLGDEDQVIDVHALARHVIARLERPAEKAAVTLSLSGEPTCIIGNDTIAEQMIYNLLENGIRYNRPHGHVDIAVMPQGDQAIIRVRDTGFGIPREAHDQIFERFFRVDKSRSKETGGTGLGLAIVKHAVLYHGGTIEVASVQGEGSTFTVSLPLHEPWEDGDAKQLHPRSEG